VLFQLKKFIFKIVGALFTTCAMIRGMQANRELKRAASAQHAATHSGKFSLAITVLAALLALVAACAISLQFNFVAESSRHFLFVALLCAELALTSSAALVFAAFSNLMLTRKRSVKSLIYDNTVAALCKRKQLKALTTQARGDAKQTLVFIDLEWSKIVARLAAAACGLAHACLSPRILSQRPINARAARAGCLLT
jgi:hypothetical protein